MVTAIELAPDQVRRFEAEEAPEKNGSTERLAAPPVAFAFSNDGPAEDLGNVRDLASGLSPPLRHRLEAGRAGSAEYARLEVPLQVDRRYAPDLWVQTPEDVEGFWFRLYVKTGAGGRNDAAHLSVSIEYVGLEVGKALAYARFLRALHSEEGKLVFYVLEGNRRRVDVGDLPLMEDDELKAKLDTQISFLEDLAAVAEATGQRLAYPSSPDAGDVRDARRSAEAVRKGWVTERVDIVHLTPTVEGARGLPLDDPDAVLALSIESAEPWGRVLGRELDLGAHVSWIERVRLAPGEREKLRERLAEGDGSEEGVEIVLVPDGDSPMHVFFAEWPRPSLERVRRQIRAFEEKYGMRSDKFSAAWKAGRKSAARVEDGETWMSLLRARKALERGASSS